MAEQDHETLNRMTFCEPHSITKPEVLHKSRRRFEFSYLQELKDRETYGKKTAAKYTPIRFRNNFYGALEMVDKLDYARKLVYFKEDVNYMTFNKTGNRLITASDDHFVSFWNWQSNHKVFYYDSRHTEDFFKIKLLPISDGLCIVSFGADYQIRVANIKPSGGPVETVQIAKHNNIVHQIAVQTETPQVILSASEDGTIRRTDMRLPSNKSEILLEIRSRDHSPNMVPLYGVDCNPLNNMEFITCGNETFVRMYDQRNASKKAVPVGFFAPKKMMKVNPDASLVSVASCTDAIYNHTGTEIVASYIDNDIYLFDSKKPHADFIHCYDGHRNFASLKELSFFGHRSEYIMSGSDCGYMYIWDKNTEAIVQWLKADAEIINCYAVNPAIPVIATSGLETEIKIWIPDSTCTPLNFDFFEKVVKRNYVARISSCQFINQRNGLRDIMMNPGIQTGMMLLNRRQQRHPRPPLRRSVETFEFEPSSSDGD